MQIVLLGFTGLVAASSAVACFWFVVVDAGQGARLLAESGVTSFLPLVVVAGAATIAVLVFRLRRAHLALISTLANRVGRDRAMDLSADGSEAIGQRVHRASRSPCCARTASWACCSITNISCCI